MEYTQLEKEAEWETKRRPPFDWPSKGMIAFENVNFAYSLDGPLVLRHLTALIRPKEKVFYQLANVYSFCGVFSSRSLISLPK